MALPWDTQESEIIEKTEIKKKPDFIPTATEKELILVGKTLVIIDWANVYGWRHERGYKTEVSGIKKILASYPNVTEKRLYFGEDEHPKSIEFLEEIKKLDFQLVTKPVKYQDGVRKCNFDIEIAVDSLASVKDFDTYVFFSGDGDFAYLYKELVKFKKRVVVIFGRNSLGRELHGLTGVYLLDFRILSKKYPPKQVRGPRLPLLSEKLVTKSSGAEDGR